MKLRFAVLVTAMFLISLVFGCKKTDEATTGEAETATAASTSEIPGTQSPNDLNPVRAQAFIDDVTIGHEVGPDGKIVTGKGGDDFAPGETIHIAMQVKDAPAGSAVKVVYYGPGEKQVGEETKQVPTGATSLAFDKATDGWGKGDYRADVFIGDEKVNTQQFQIVDARGAGK
jgi:hypothetical protein